MKTRHIQVDTYFNLIKELSRKDSDPHAFTFGSGKNQYDILRVCAGFDIETTTPPDMSGAYMWIWQLSLDELVFTGRTWESFTMLVNALKDFYNLSDKRRLLVWDANLSYEFQFLAGVGTWSEVFAKTKRNPLKAIFNGVLEFRDCLAISQGNLDQLAKDYCSTRKMVGDLDYTIQRNSTYELSAKEWGYVLNDVIILSEFAGFIFREYAEKEVYIPLTQTATIRHMVKKSVDKRIMQAVKLCFPSERLYNIMMRWLFRGGWVHGSALHNGLVVEADTFDKKSSYPWAMLSGYYPVSQFVRRDSNKWEEYLDTKCCIIHCKFYNIGATGIHTIESSNKIISAKNPVYDNGRLLMADEIEVILTELDYKNYELFYGWDRERFEVLELMTAERGNLPRYLLDVTLWAYAQKDALKKEIAEAKRRGANVEDIATLETRYAIIKKIVNGTYGMTVSKLHSEEIKWNGEEWDIEAGQSFQRQISKAFLLPQWGVWITAHSRHSELYAMWLCGNDGVYGDTDSVKTMNFEAHREAIDKYNAEIIARNLERCCELGISEEIFGDIGTFEYEGHYDRFKHLGAKRYITDEEGTISVTVAGMRKGTLQKVANEMGVDPFDIFEDGLEIEENWSDKLRPVYIDQPTSAIIDGELMTSERSVVLAPVRFTMNMTPEYLGLINELQHRRERKIYGERC